MGLLAVTGRSPEVVNVTRRYEIDDQASPDARQIAMSFARLAAEMLLRIRHDSPDMVQALELLADSRDAFIQAHFRPGFAGPPR